MARSISELVDTSAEAGVIASIIYHPEYLLSDNNLQPRFFYGEENQILYWAVNELVQSGVTNIDILNLQNILNSNAAVQSKLKKYNLSNLTQFIELARAAARGTYEEYKLLVNQVISLAFRRELCNLSVDIGKECFNQEITLDDLNDYVNHGLSKIVDKFVFGGDTVQFGEKLDSLLEEIRENRNDDGTIGLPSMLPTLNEYMTYGKGELVLLAGASGRGKSSFFLAEACNLLKQGIPCVIIDSELNDLTWTPRLISCLSGVTVKQIKNGKYTKEEEARINKTIEWIKKQSLVHEYEPVFNKIKVEQICRKWANKDKLGFMVYDYIKPTERYGAAEISQSLGLMTDFLKSLAGNMKIPILAGLQLNKMTGQVSDSQKPERYADVLMYWKKKTIDMLQRDGIECGNFYIQIIKNRNGLVLDEDDYIDVQFTGDYMRITEAKKHNKTPKTPETPFDK